MNGQYGHRKLLTYRIMTTIVLRAPNYLTDLKEKIGKEYFFIFLFLPID